MICGDPYIGFNKPTNCPFCGAHEQYMVHYEEWKDTNDVDLTEESRKNLKASLKLEVSNTEFYLCISKTFRDPDIKALFKALSKVESEHASTICKLLKREKPGIELKKDLCSSMSIDEVLAESSRRENRAVKLYTEFLKQATEPRVREFFTALIEVESDHIDLVNKESEPIPDLSRKERSPITNNDLKKLDRVDEDFYDSYRMYED